MITPDGFKTYRGGHRCTTCPDDEPHHWTIAYQIWGETEEDEDIEFPEGILVCRHCPANRELTEEDIDRYAY